MRVLVVDDHEVVRRGIRMLIESRPGSAVCAEAGTGRQAIAEAARRRPEIVVLDVSLPDLSGLDVAREILRSAPEMKIVFLTVHESEQVVREVLAAGALGFVVKNEAARDLLDALDAVARGRPYLGPRAATTVMRAFVHGPSGNGAGSPGAGLTAREKEVLRLVAGGLSSRQVAAQLGIALKTAEAHRANVMRKLGAGSVADLVRHAVRSGLLRP